MAEIGFDKTYYLSPSKVNTLKSPRLNRCGAAFNADDDIMPRLDAVAAAAVADFDADAVINLPVLSIRSWLIAHCSVMFECSISDTIMFKLVANM